MDTDNQTLMQDYRDGQDSEFRRWQAAFKDIGFTLHPGISITENLIEYGRWWKSNADKFDQNFR